MLQSPFDLLKSQIDGITQSITNKVQELQQLNAEINGLKENLADYERALELERYSGLATLADKEYEGIRT